MGGGSGVQLISHCKSSVCHSQYHKEASAGACRGCRSSSRAAGWWVWSCGVAPHGCLAPALAPQYNARPPKPQINWSYQCSGSVHCHLKRGNQVHGSASAACGPLHPRIMHARGAACKRGACLAAIGAPVCALCMHALLVCARAMPPHTTTPHQSRLSTPAAAACHTSHRAALPAASQPLRLPASPSSVLGAKRGAPSPPCHHTPSAAPQRAGICW